MMMTISKTSTWTTTSKFAFILAAILLVGAATTALATGPVTRTGSEYSGVKNRNGCEVLVEKGTELHVKCASTVGSTGPAFVRYRFLRDVGGVRGPATVSSVIKTISKHGNCAVTTWQGPIRTLRIRVPLGCYIHVQSVTWQQP